MKKLIVITCFVFVLSVTFAQQPKGNSVVIIDRDLPSLEILVKQIHASSKIVYLEKSDHPLFFVLKVLRAHAPVSALHIITDGRPGELIFAGTSVTTEVLQKNDEILGLWKEYFSQNGDLLLYGCEVAKGHAGINFIKHMKLLTQLDVAASANLTGSYKKMGDWNLEIKAGKVEAQPAVSKNIIESYPAVLRATSQVALTRERNSLN